mgnify:CR=1 FL=1
MSTVTKKQISLAVFAVVVATAMIVGTLASANIASANQSINLKNHQHQHAVCQTAGGHSSVSKSCNNFAFNHQRNSGGNANLDF